MTSSSTKKRVTKLVQELLSIFWSYLKTYIGAAAIFALFFFFYAGIKTNRIPVELLASLGATLLSLAIAFFAMHFFAAKFSKTYQYVLGDVYEVAAKRVAKKLAYNQKAEVARLLVRDGTFLITILLVKTIIIYALDFDRRLSYKPAEHPLERKPVE